MKIKVNSDDLLRIAEAVKALPVRGTFEDADRWVGCVITLEQIASNSPPAEENTEEGG